MRSCQIQTIEKVKDFLKGLQYKIFQLPIAMTNAYVFEGQRLPAHTECSRLHQFYDGVVLEKKLNIKEE